MKQINYWWKKINCLFLLSLSIFPQSLLWNNKCNKHVNAITNLSHNNFEQDNILQINNEYETLSLFTKFSNVSYEKYENRNINIYYSINNKREVIYSFLKNVFCYNLKRYFNDWLSNYLNINYPIINYIKQDINYSLNDINLDFQFIVNGQEYTTNKNSSIMNNIFIDNNGNAFYTLELNKNFSTIKIKNKFDNFIFREISSIFNYSVQYLETDVSNIRKNNIKKLFTIYNNVPTEMLYERYLQNNKDGLLLKNIRYEINTGFQTFSLNYVGTKFFEPTPIDISIKDNNIINKVNIFSIDESSIENIFHIGTTLKNIGYSIKMKKNFNTNKVDIIFLINQIDNELIFFNILKNIQTEYEINLNFNNNHILVIDIKEELKDKYLPISFRQNDIEIKGSIDLKDVLIKSVNILTYSNNLGSIDIEINYSYKNYFGILCEKKDVLKIDNLLSINYKNKSDIYTYLKDNFFINNIFNYDEFKKSFITSNNFSWLIEEKNVFISTHSLDASYNNGILLLSYFLKNKYNEIIFKDNFKIDTKEIINDSGNNSENKTELNSNWYIWLILSILITLIISCIFFFIKKNFKKNKNILK